MIRINFWQKNIKQVTIGKKKEGEYEYQSKIKK